MHLSNCRMSVYWPILSRIEVGTQRARSDPAMQPFWHTLDRLLSSKWLLVIALVAACLWDFDSLRDACRTLVIDWWR